MATPMHKAAVPAVREPEALRETTPYCWEVDLLPTAKPARLVMRLAVAVATAALALAASPRSERTFLPRPALANPSCTSNAKNFTSHFDGGTGPSHNLIYGVRAWITTRNSGFCSTVPNTWLDNSAWAMLAGNGPSNYAQSGFDRSIWPNLLPNTTCCWYFAAYLQDANHNEVYAYYPSKAVIGRTTNTDRSTTR